MGKITPRLKTLLVLVTFLGFTNFILSETNLDLRKIVQKNIFVENFEEAVPVATSEVAKASETRKKIMPLTLPSVSGIKMSAAANEQPDVTVGEITHATCDENSDGGITINVSGGTTPYTYSWSNGDTTKDLSNVPAGTYSVTVTDNNNESATLDNLKVEAQDNINPVAKVKDITIQLDNNGQATISAGDIDDNSNDNCGIPTLSLSKDSFDCSNVGSNPVTLTATDNNGNTSTATATVTVEDKIDPIVITQNITVQLDENGTATIAQDEVNNGSTDSCGGLTFSTDKTTFSCSDIGSNTATLTVTDSNGNSSTGTATVTVEDKIKPVAIAQDIIIELDATGKATITPADVDNGSNDACGIASLSLSKESFDCSNVGVNNVTLTVEDNNGNSHTATATVTIEDNIAPVVKTKNITVQLDANGIATIDEDAVNDGSTDSCDELTFSTNITSFDCNDVGANTVELTVTDANGNSASKNATVTVEDNIIPVIASVSNINVDNDNGLCTASVNIPTPSVNDNCTVAAPTGIRSDNKPLSDPYPTGETTITWTATDAHSNDAAPVTQKVLVKDNEAPVAPQLDNITWGCSYTVEVPVAMDNCDNEITATASSATTFDSSGEITWTFKDAAGNTSTAKQIITIDPISVNIEKQDIVCFDAANGTAEALVTGGVGPFTYNWGSAGSTSKVEDLSPGTYSVTVTDANGCDASAQVTITQPDQLQANFTSTNVTCSGNQDGSITISDATGGFGNYEYSINGTNWQQSASFTNLNGGSYNVQIRDAQHTSCVVILETDLVIEEPQELMMTDATSTPTTCFGASDGTVTAGTVSGGNGEYQYSIDNTTFSSSTTFEDLPAGTHTIFVKDSKGCSLQKTVTVTEPSVLNATVSRNNVSCYEGNDGKITITSPTGGSGNYEFSINGSNWQTSGNFTGLEKGTFTVQVRDKNAPDCVILLKENYQITQPEAPLTVEVTTTRTSAYGSSTGSATAEPSGGTSGYTYEWRKEGQSAIIQNTKTANNLAAGNYVLTVKDKNGCKIDRPFTIIDKVRANIIAASECLSVHDMIRTSSFRIDMAVIAGGVGSKENFIYEWHFGNGASPQTATGQGSFQVTYDTSGDKDITLYVTDEANVKTEYSFPHYVGGCFEGCGTTSNFEINTDNFFIGDINGNPLTGEACEATAEKFLWIDITKNANGYSLSAELNYSVSDGETTTPRKAIGCFAELISGVPGGNGQNEPKYAQIPTGLFKLFPVQATGNDADKLIWKCGETFNVEQINIRWTNQDKRGCNEGTKPMCYGPSDEVEVITPILATAVPEHVLCKGLETGSLTITAAGGMRPYQYSINGENGNYQNSNEFFNLAAGEYASIWVKDSRGRKVRVNPVTILEPDTALEATTEDVVLECFGEQGEASVNASGGTAPYTYLWNDSDEQTTATATGLTAGDYTVTVIDANGCQVLKEVTITQPEQLSVAEAGDDQAFNCGFNSTFLEANTPETGVGTWTIVSGNGGIVADVNDPSSEFTGEADTYTLQWTIAHEDGTCSTMDEVQITFVEDCSTLDFDGVDDHVLFGDNYNLNSGTFSMEAWVKLKSTSGIKTVLSKRNMRNPGEGGYDLVINQGAPTFRWGNNAVSSSSKLGTQRWYHIAVIFKDSRANLYVDGIRVGNAAANNPASTSFPFIIGAEYDNNNPEIPQNYFHGWIEEVRIWNTALTEEQLRFMMNQRLEVDVNPVKGDVLPLNVPGDLAWTSLGGYYQLLVDEAVNGITKDKAANKVDGQLKNITTPQENTAPLPYVSVAGGPWRDRNIWQQPVVWDAPNSKGINDANINWNIVKINHDITSGGHDINVLGLLSEGGTLKMANPNETEDWKNAGQALRISHYLKLNGNINLVGESQLIQTDIKTTADITDAAVEFPQSITSVLEESSKGYIERAQQGTANSFNYNYWSSPVSLQGAANNSTYTIGSVMMDGSSTSNYGKPLSFGAWHEFADGAPATPRKISNYWLHKFRGTANVYSEWVHIGSTGTLLAGEGYTMKGTAGNAAIEDRQNYVFKGKPNNGTIALTIGTDQNYLLGNPYPSAIDVNAFILENLKDVTGGKNNKNVFNGAVYFWDHFAGKSHILLEYIGGYATRNLLDGVPAISNDQRVNANDQKSNKIPGRYIPVAQGFFINTTLDEEIAGEITIHGGDVKFQNSQRAFVRESTGNTGNSLFLRPEQNTKSTAKKDDRAKIRLDFKSPMKFNRQILVGVDPNTTDGFDLGYDAPMNDNSPEDMFWMIGNREFVIQGVPDFNLDRILPLGVLIQEEGDISISVNKLENIEEDFNIFLYDKEADIYFDLREGDYKIEMEPGYYSERLAIVFQDKTEEELPEEEEEEEEDEDDEDEDEEEQTEKPGTGENPGPEEPGKLDPDNPEFGKVDIFYLTANQELVVRNPDLLKIESLLLYSLSGQVIEEFYSLPAQKEITLPIRSYNSAVYTVKLYTERGLIQKKIIINN